MSRLAQFLANCKPIAPWAAGVMWLIWGISCVFGPGNLDLNGQVVGADHSAFHTAAVLIAKGQGSGSYDYPSLSIFAHEQERITGKPDFLDPFRNPPFYAIPYLLTAKLAYLPSYTIWAIVGLVALVGGCCLLSGRPFKSTLGWSLTFYPVFAVVSFGQNSLLSFGIFALTYRLLTWERRFFAGMCAGLLFYKPQLLIFVGGWWLLSIRRYWPSVIGLGVMGAILAVLSLVLLPDETVAWVRMLPEIARYDAFDFYNLHNPRGFGALLTDNKSVGNWFGIVGVLLAVGWLIRFWMRHHVDPALMFSAVIFATLWGSPHTMTYEWALAVIPAVLILNRRPELRSAVLPMFAIAWIILFISTPLTKTQLGLFGVAAQFSVPVLAVVALRLEKILNASAIAASAE